MTETVDRREGVAQKGKPAWNRRKPQRYEVRGCTERCSVGMVMLGDKLFKTVHGWYEQALDDYEISHRMDKVGHHLSYGALARHRRHHLVPLVPPDHDDPLKPEKAEKVSHIDVLEEIIAKGARNINPAKISPDILLKAMDMHNRLTQGKALDDTMAAISAAMAAAGGQPVDDQHVDHPDIAPAHLKFRGPAPERNEAAVKSPFELAEELAASG